MKGIFELNNAPDLLGKLKRDFKKLQDDPLDSDAAYNFFVTAGHMLEWLYPDADDAGNRKKRKDIYEGEPLLQVCAHIANGAKHFEPTRDKAVSDTKKEGDWGAPFNNPKWYPSTWGFQGRFMIYLDGVAKEQFGETISVSHLAQRVMEYWEQHPEFKDG